MKSIVFAKKIFGNWVCTCHCIVVLLVFITCLKVETVSGIRVIATGYPVPSCKSLVTMHDKLKMCRLDEHSVETVC